MKKSIIMMFILFAAVCVCYGQPYTLEVTISALSDSSYVELDPPGGVYDQPTLVTLTAIPGASSTVQEFFYRWTGDLSGYDNPSTLYVDGPKSVTAYFLHNDPPAPTPIVSPPPTEYRLDIIISGSISGSTVTADPPGPVYDGPTTVTLTANSGGSEFLYSWGGDLSGNNNPVTIYVDGEKVVYAYFLHGDAPSPGSVWFEPDTLHLRLIDYSGNTKILCNSGAQTLAAYGFRITFDETIVRVNDVQEGTDGFIAAANYTTPGELTVAGFDTTGKGPGSRLHILDIAWQGLADGTTTLHLEVENLVDNGSNDIGIPQGIDGTIIVTSSCLPGDVNEDGTLDIIDALLVAQHYVGLDPFNFNVDCADVNCDWIITIVDALLIAQYYVHIIPGFCL